MPPPRGCDPPECCTATIEIRLATVDQLFNSLDPSPFHEKELDREAEEYIVGSVDEAPLQTPLALVIRLPAGPQLARAESVQDAIHNHFSYRVTESDRRLRGHFRDGRKALLIGLAFLACCVATRELVFAPGTGAVSQMLAEGLLILGWVAMWHPIQIFLYDWWPIRHQARLFAKLATMPVVAKIV
ncbi:MAG: hypothetical protein FJ271_29790 [Planctomycetes bacterium]|nr:hypothetical protein [Planctomycetota bacterium]